MAKTVSFAALHFSIAFSLAYVMTGSLVVGGTLALVEPAVNTLAFYFHEKLWKRREQGRGVKHQGTPAATAISF